MVLEYHGTRIPLWCVAPECGTMVHVNHGTRVRTTRVRYLIYDLKYKHSGATGKPVGVVSIEDITVSSILPVRFQLDSDVCSASPLVLVDVPWYHWYHGTMVPWYHWYQPLHVFT
jgi:hypothetical protein